MNLGSLTMFLFTGAWNFYSSFLSLKLSLLFFFFLNLSVSHNLHPKESSFPALSQMFGMRVKISRFYKRE